MVDIWSERPWRAESVRFFEAELRDSVVVLANGGTGRPTRVRESRFESEDEAYGAFAQALAAKRKGGYVLPDLHAKSKAQHRGSPKPPRCSSTCTSRRGTSDSWTSSCVAAARRSWLRPPTPGSRTIDPVRDGCCSPTCLKWVGLFPTTAPHSVCAHAVSPSQ